MVNKGREFKRAHVDSVVFLIKVQTMMEMREPMMGKGISVKVHLILLLNNSTMEGLSNPKVLGGGLYSQVTPICKKGGKTHKRKCLTGFDVCFKYEKRSHYAKDCRSCCGLCGSRP